MFLQHPMLWQTVAGLTSGLIVACYVGTFAFPAVSLHKMALPDSPIHFSAEQLSWFATLQLLMSIPGAFFGGVLCESFGPRRVLLHASPLLCASFMAMAAASSDMIVKFGIAEVLLMSCRGVQGLTGGLLNATAFTFTFETTGKRHRGLFTALLDSWATFGMCLSYVFGCFYSWETVALVVPLVTAVPAFVALLVCPESPLWLARKDKKEETLASFMKYRDASEIPEELEAAKNTSIDERSFKYSLQEAFKKPNFLALLSVMLIMFLKEVSGAMVVTIYITHIFQSAGIGLRPEVSSIVVGVVRLVSSWLGLILLHQTRRKPLLSVGTLIGAVSSAAIGAFFFLQDVNYDVTTLGWLPLAALVTFMVGYGALVSPVCWLVSVEVLPGSVRSVGCGTASAFQTTTAFLISKTFPSLQAAIGLHSVFWGFAGSSLLCLVFVIMCIPDTYRLSLIDVEKYWTNLGKKSLDKSRV